MSGLYNYAIFLPGHPYIESTTVLSDIIRSVCIISDHHTVTDLPEATQPLEDAPRVAAIVMPVLIVTGAAAILLMTSCIVFCVSTRRRKYKRLDMIVYMIMCCSLNIIIHSLQ